MLVFIFVPLIVKTFLAIMLILFDEPIESIANATLKVHVAFYLGWWSVIVNAFSLMLGMNP